jgi:hypothetical protein
VLAGRRTEAPKEKESYEMDFFPTLAHVPEAQTSAQPYGEMTVKNAKPTQIRGDRHRLNAVRLLLASVFENNGRPTFKKMSLTRMPIRLGADGVVQILYRGYKALSPAAHTP